MKDTIYKYISKNKETDEISLCAEFLTSYESINSILRELKEENQIEKKDGKIVAVKKKKREATSHPINTVSSSERRTLRKESADNTMSSIGRGLNVISTNDILEHCGAILPESIKKALIAKGVVSMASFVSRMIENKHDEDESGFEKEVFNSFLNYFKENPNNTDYLGTFSEQKGWLLSNVDMNIFQLREIFGNVEITLTVLGESIKCLL